MTIKSFIEKAIEGGWETREAVLGTGKKFFPTAYEHDRGLQAEMFLDPSAWEAVGRVEGWKGKPCNCGGKIVDAFGTGKNQFPYQCEKCCGYLIAKELEGTWRSYMHRMIDALAEGKTLEEYISTL